MANSDAQPADLLARAEDLYRRAHSEEALQALEGCGDWTVPFNERGILLRAKILLVRNPIAALDELPEDDEAFVSYDGRLGARMMRARAYMASRNLRSAEAQIRQAELLVRDDDHENRCLLASVRAYMAWQRREYDPGNRYLVAAMTSADPTTRLGMLNLRAWMHCGLGDYRSQLGDLVECVRMYERDSSAYHLLVVARTLHSILGLAWEIADIQAGEEARRCIESLPWTQELDTYRFLCLRGLGWHTFLAGHSDQAYGIFDAAKGAAPSPAWLVMAHTDHAYVARLDGDERIARYELERAQALAEGVDWHSTRLEEKNALLTTAVLLAPVDVRAAQRVLTVYDRLQAHALNAGIEFSHEPPRLYASRDYAEGVIQAAFGSEALAIRLLTGAYRVFLQYDFALRAMLAARALFEITHEEHWFEAALLHAAAYPSARLSDRLHANHPPK